MVFARVLRPRSLHHRLLRCRHLNRAVPRPRPLSRVGPFSLRSPAAVAQRPPPLRRRRRRRVRTGMVPTAVVLRPMLLPPLL